MKNNKKTSKRLIKIAICYCLVCLLLLIIASIIAKNFYSDVSKSAIKYFLHNEEVEEKYNNVRMVNYLSNKDHKVEQNTAYLHVILQTEDEREYIIKVYLEKENNEWIVKTWNEIERIS